MNSILLIDDDPELGEMLSAYLDSEGYTLSTEYSAADGLERFHKDSYDLVILDIMLPDTSGFNVLGQIRAESMVPVIMLTGRGEEIDRVVGLEMGADDYVSKPFPLRELLARMRAVLRRFEYSGAAMHVSETGKSRIVINNLTIDMGARTAMLDGEEVHLTGAEFSILEQLGEGMGSVVEREALMEKALGKGADIDDYVLNVHMSNLRKKLGNSVRIKTIRGRGYLMVACAETEH